MGPRSYMRYLVDRNVVMRRMTVDNWTQLTKQRGRIKTQHWYMQPLLALHTLCSSRINLWIDIRPFVHVVFYVFLCVLLLVVFVYYCCLVCIVVVVLCVLLSSYVYLLYYVCIAVFTLDAGLLARSQYSEGPATGHLDTCFSWFPCA